MSALRQAIVNIALGRELPLQPHDDSSLNPILNREPPEPPEPTHDEADVLDISAYNLAGELADLIGDGTISDDGDGNTIIDLDGTNSIQLNGVTTADLTDANFIL